MFTLWAVVMWTVNDFPVYAVVSGWSTKGYMACSVCKEDVTSGWHVEKLNRLDFAPFGKTKNVFDTLMGTIFDIEGKTNDTIKARLDLERMGIQRGLWMNRDNDKARRDIAFFSIKPSDREDFLKFVSSVKFPDGYASNIARYLRHDIVQVIPSSFLYKYDPRDGSLARRGIACWSCQLSLDISNRKGSRQAEKNYTQQGEARWINYRGMGSM
ncbi:hypothetical protein L3X38_000922 [Prunus dulcis]|uniref:Uncharacterized protein n=1 Tax=Prunus dulcis TaxID=3755 RepID=A0AAD4WR26_PRUDU|nr:hypothetical protein L3X38_000922 [Prunus dulcis]